MKTQKGLTYSSQNNSFQRMKQTMNREHEQHLQCSNECFTLLQIAVSLSWWELRIAPVMTVSLFYWLHISLDNAEIDLDSAVLWIKFWLVCMNNFKWIQKAVIAKMVISCSFHNLKTTETEQRPAKEHNMITGGNTFWEFSLQQILTQRTLTKGTRTEIK